MDITFEGDLHERLIEIINLEQAGKIQVRKDLAIGSTYFKLQPEYYNGNGIFFNPESENRFSLSDKSKWPMYLADSPHTALSESHQGESFIDRSDFETNCMAEISTVKSLRVFDATRLAPHLRLTVGDLMGPKAVYSFTQELAKELSKYADGLEYLSRHTGKTCVVLWSDVVDGGGILSTVSVTPLNQYEYQGKSAKQILKAECNIQVVG